MLDTNFLGNADAGADAAPSGETAENIAAPDASEAVESAPLADILNPDNGDTAADDSSSLTTDELSEEEKLQQIADDPSTPAFAREKIKEAMAYAGRLKNEKSALQTQYDELQTKASEYEGKTLLSETDLQRLKQAEEAVFKIQSFSATADDADTFLKETNPRLYKEYQQQAVWKALEREDGTPDLDNIQAVVDKFAGEAGKVKAKDVLQAIEAIKNGVLDAEDIYDFQSETDREAHAKLQEAERFKQEAAEYARHQERQVRSQEINHSVNALQSEIAPKTLEYLDKFKMNKVENEPKWAGEYKDELREKLGTIINNAPNEIRELGEIFKAYQQLQEPTGVDAKTASEQVRQFQQSPAFQRFFNKGVSEMLSKIEKTVARSAYQYKLMMKGYEAEVAAGREKARPVIGAPNQSRNLPNLTAEEIAKLSGAEREKRSSEYVSAQLREVLNPTANRLGG